jgi:pilus assembly protein Flp/PilA
VSYRRRLFAGAVMLGSRRPQLTKKGKPMIQILAARIQLAKMRAEEGQALVEYALILSLIAVVAIAALTVTGHNVRDILNNIANDV